MKVYRFIVPTDRFYPLPSNPSISVRGCIAVVAAESEERARDALRNYAVEEGLDARWLEVAKVTTRPIEDGRVLLWAEV